MYQRGVGHPVTLDCPAQYTVLSSSTPQASLNACSSSMERRSITSVKCPSDLFLKPATRSPVQIEARMTGYYVSGSKETDILGDFFRNISGHLSVKDASAVPRYSRTSGPTCVR